VPTLREARRVGQPWWGRATIKGGPAPKVERIEVRIIKNSALDGSDSQEGSKDLPKNDLLAKGLPGKGPFHIEPLPVSAFMKVSLSGDGFRIDALHTEEQFVDSGDTPSQWAWNVTPLRTGRRFLRLTVAARIRFPGYPDGTKDVAVMERDIVVRVNAMYWSKELLATYWYLVAVMLAMVVGILWLKARKSPVGRRTTTIDSSHLSLTLAHVLFMDVVEYSKLPMDEGTLLIQQLQDVVRSTTAFQRADKNQELIKLPTGDGMALVFLGHDPQDAVLCATELSRCLRLRDDIQLRMGLHTGPVYRVADINANANVAGGGINIAERVMSCGDSGHIWFRRRWLRS
jgi:hypothetical protein